jgi:signal transduction histidine kinase
MFSLYVFVREWISKYIYLAVGYSITGAFIFAVLPMNVPWVTVVFIAMAMPPMILAFYKALHSQVLRENRIMWLHVAAILFYIVAGFASNYFADHLLYMTPVLTNMYMIMAQSLILVSQYTDTMKREQELAARTAIMEQSARIRSYMIDTLSHEVRTPLTVMSTYAQLAAEKLSEGDIDERTHANLNTISREAKRLAELASNTLRLSRLSDMPGSEGFAAVNIGELTEQVTRLFEPIAGKNGRKLHVSLPETSVNVLGSPDSITRLLWNLLDNAVTHSGYGDIHVMVCLDNDYVRLTVKDEGAGVPPDLLPNVFERGISGRNDGTGLGLAMCSEIAREMNGEITLESEPGKGTTVTLVVGLFSPPPAKTSVS